jgi:hypothetical protein
LNREFTTLLKVEPKLWLNPTDRQLCLMKSPFLLQRLLSPRIVDTLLDDDVRPPLTAPDPGRERALARCVSPTWRESTSERPHRGQRGALEHASGDGALIVPATPATEPLIALGSQGVQVPEWSPHRADGLSSRHRCPARWSRS